MKSTSFKLNRPPINTVKEVYLNGRKLKVGHDYVDGTNDNLDIMKKLQKGEITLKQAKKLLDSDPEITLLGPLPGDNSNTITIVCNNYCI